MQSHPEDLRPVRTTDVTELLKGLSQGGVEKLATGSRANLDELLERMPARRAPRDITRSPEEHEAMVNWRRDQAEA